MTIMEELDILKKNWQKTTNFEQVSEENIYGMIHKKSSSIVKWILIISILEFVVLNSLSYLFPNDKNIDTLYISLDKLIVFFEYFNYIITFYFIYLFYRNYRNITVISDTKTLMQNILKTRKSVQNYIWYNMICIFTMISLMGFLMIFNEMSQLDISKRIFFCISIIFIVLLMIFFVWLFYKLLYGFLLKKLKQNYKELNQSKD
jgi:hypothetical protein